MSRFSENYKNMVKSGFKPDYKCCVPKVSPYNNNNTSNISNNMRKSQILTSGVNTCGCNSVQYGNFGNLLNASPENNSIIDEITNNILNNEEDVNYVYIQNTINNYSTNSCDIVKPSYIEDLIYNGNPPIIRINNGTNVDYNQFYNSFYNLREALNKKKIESSYFIFKNKY